MGQNLAAAHTPAPLAVPAKAKSAACPPPPPSPPCRYLKPAESSWQPSSLLPEASSPDFLDAVHELRTAAAALPSDYLVVLVGDMVTEEALPSYM